MERGGKSAQKLINKPYYGWHKLFVFAFIISNYHGYSDYKLSLLTDSAVITFNPH